MGLRDFKLGLKICGPYRIEQVHMNKYTHHPTWIWRSWPHEHLPPSYVLLIYLGANALIDTALATASYALRATVHHTLGLSPGAIVFARDMLLDIPFVADLIQLRDKRQALIDHNLCRENNRRRNFDYIVGNYVFEIIKMGLSDSKLGLKTRGPYRIEQVHTNGTLTIRRGPGVLDRLIHFPYPIFLLDP